MSITTWLKRNKEGAIVGGIVSFLIFFFFRPLFEYIEILIFGFEGGGGIIPFLDDILHMFPYGPRTALLIILVLIGALIGAFIDSKWRPLR